MGHLREILADEQGLSVSCVVGSLRRHITFWQRIVPHTHAWILDVISRGYALPFKQGVSVPEMCFPNNHSAMDHYHFVNDEIRRLISIGAVRSVDNAPRVISPLSVATNTPKLRLILDLSVFNDFIDVTSVKYETLDSIRDLLPRGGFLGKFDMKSGYHHVEIRTSDQTYLGFAWDLGSGRQFFVFTVLPFGLASAPFLFTKLFRPLVRYWRSLGFIVALYLDDGLFAAATLEKCKQVSQVIRSDLSEAGVITGAVKTVWEPVPSIDWLGLLVDLGLYQLSVSQKRIASTIDTIRQLQISGKPTVRQRLQLTGKLISMSVVVGPVVQLKTRQLYYNINLANRAYDRHVRLSEGEKAELNFWLENLCRLNVRSLGAGAGAVRLSLETDASNTGAGVICSDWRGQKDVAAATFSRPEAGQSSTYRELKTVLFGLRSFASNLRDQRVKIQTDNTGVVSIILKGSNKPLLQDLAERIHAFSVEFGCTLEPVWVPRAKNVDADAASRLLDFDDWGVRDQFFVLCDKRWGPHTIDRFADHRNAKLPRFNSRYFVPGTENVDAFASSWQGEVNWLCPPIHLLSRVVRYLAECQGKGTLALPDWPSLPCFALLRPDGSNWAPFVTDFLRFPVGTYIFQPASQIQSVFNSPFAQSPFLFLRLDFTPPGL